MNHFDSLKIKAFDKVTKLFGYDAFWTSSVSNESYIARVGYKDPSDSEKLSGIDSWDPEKPYMEYRVGKFPGLKELSDKNLGEQVTITGKGSFVVQEVKTKSDGDTYVALLVKI